MYQDGVFVDELTFPQKLKNYSKEEYIYLGAANPNREETPNYFKGYIDSFAIYDTALNDDEILEISSSINFSIFSMFEYPTNLYPPLNWMDKVYELLVLEELTPFLCPNLPTKYDLN